MTRKAHYNVKHGHTVGKVRSPEYISWSSMKSRCLNEKDPSYDEYGKRGISVCDRWKHFPNFLKDMGPRPRGTTLDRKNNNGNYEPGNCRWSTPKEQGRNKRNNHSITFNNTTMSMSEWAERIGITHRALRWRLKHNWPLDKALILPDTRGWKEQRKIRYVASVPIISHS